MDKKKILTKPKGKPQKSMVINGVQLLKHNPALVFKKHKEVKKALFEALFVGDKEAFIDILSGYVRAHNILEVCSRTGLSRTVVYEAISQEGNPSLDTLCKIMTSFDKVA